MSALAAVGVDDDLAACQAGIAVRPADDEFSCRVDEILDALLEQIQYFL